MKKVLTIAGSDCSGGAGIQADIKTMSAHGVFAMSVIAAITAQNTQGVFKVQDIDKDVIAAQIDAIFTDIDVDAVKIGMVSKIESIDIISEKLKEYKPENIVLDPVMISKSGFDLLRPESKVSLVKKLLPLATVVTPNLPEALEIVKTYNEMLSKEKRLEIDSIENSEDMKRVAKFIYNIGPKYVLIKGGHLKDDAVDILFDGEKMSYFEGKKINTKNTHGTGCTLSSAIASNLALGCSMQEAVKKAKDYITIAIKHSLDIGKGVGPTNHFYTLYKKAGMIK